MGAAYDRGEGTEQYMISPMRTWVLALAFLLGCGPIAYVNQVTREASTKVDRARELEAPKYSPYWWTRAVTYLRMAREVAAHADMQGANRFGRLAADAADKAAAEAQDPKRPVYLNEEVAPAKAKDDADDAPAPTKKQKQKQGEVAPAKE